MKDLEDAGFIISPHTSSGRIPTQKGYRFFVDSLVTMKSLNKSEISKSAPESEPKQHSATAAARPASLQS